MNPDQLREIKTLLKALRERCPEETTCGKIAHCLEKNSIDEIIECCNLRLQSLQESPDLYTQGVQHTLLGALYALQNRPEQAAHHYRQAAQVFAICEGSAAGIALMGLGQFYESRQELDKAARAYQESADFLSQQEDVLLKKIHALQLALERRIQETTTKARNYQSAGEEAQSHGKWEEARQSYEKSLSLFQQLGDRAAIQQIQTRLQEILQQEQHARTATDGTQYTPRTTLPLFPVVGRIPAGSLREAFDLNLGYTQTEEVWIEGKRYQIEPLENRANHTLPLHHYSNYFVLQISGDSMEGANIRDGDYLLLEKQEEAANGDIVALQVDDQVTLKRFFRKDDHLFLEPANPRQIPIVIINNSAVEESVRQSYAEQNIPVEIRIATDVKLLAKALLVFKPVS